MRKFIKAAGILFTVFAVAMLAGCENETSGSNSWNMHYCMSDYGGSSGTLYSAMIRFPDNSDVAILATSENGGDLYEGYFVQLTKTKSGTTYTFEGTRGSTPYSVSGTLSSNAFTIASSSESMQALGFTVGESIQHWTERTSGSFVY
ncbi:MAG: hypothetical protein K6B17_04195 [Treponema sp.]|nr:hypothetical protein [Treponema sp.]